MNVRWDCTLLPPVERQHPLCLHSASRDGCFVLTAFEQRVNLTKKMEDALYLLFLFVCYEFKSCPFKI